MRTWRLDVDTIRIEGDGTRGLEIAFEVQRGLTPPNTCTVRVWNLSESHRRQLGALTVRGKAPGRVRTELVVGRREGAAPGTDFLLFKGDLRYARNERDGADWVTTIEGDDGGRALVDATIQRSFPPGTRVDQVVRACADALGLGLGNLPAMLAGLKTYDQGTVLSGRASDALRGVLRGIGLSYSIQHGVLQAQRAGVPLNVPVVRLSPTSGLIGSPTRTPEGRVLATALLMPGLDPGARVQLESQEIPRGTYGIRGARAEGDASATPWYSHLELETPS